MHGNFVEASSQGGCPWYTTDDIFYKGAWTPRPLTDRVIASTHICLRTPGKSAMLAGTLQTWLKRRIAVRQRLERICTSYLLFLMIVTTKHSLEEAARFSGLHKWAFAYEYLRPGGRRARAAVTLVTRSSRAPPRGDEGRVPSVVADAHTVCWGVASGRVVRRVSGALQGVTTSHPVAHGVTWPLWRAGYLPRRCRA